MKKPKLSYVKMSFQSQCLGRRATFNLLLPYGNATQNSCVDKGPYKTLWLLHGMQENQEAWELSSIVEHLARERSLAVVMPDAENSFYCDMAAGPDFYTFIVKELTDILWQVFPLSRKREDNFIAGLSMGGYGALRIGLLNSGRFSAVGSFSGAVNVIETFRNGIDGKDVSEEEKNELINQGLDPEKVSYDRYMMKKTVRSIIGDAEPDSLSGTEYDLAFLLRTALGKGTAPYIYQACGFDDFLYGQNLWFRDFARKLGAELSYEEWEGEHNWAFWNAAIARYINFLADKGLL